MTKEKQYTNEQIKEFVKNIKTDVGLFQKGVEGHIKDDIVLVVGAAKTGKSTIMNMMAQKDLEIRKYKGSWGLDVVNNDYAGEITAEKFEKMVIGHGGDCTTKLPNYIMVGKTQFWDCPGFNDNRDPDVEISNMYYIQQILKHAAVDQKCALKFIIVQSEDGTRSCRGNSFKNAINTICKLYVPTPPENIDPKSLVYWFKSNLIELINATTFIFTKVEDLDSKPEDYLNDIIDRVIPDKQDSKRGNDEDQMFFLFLQTMQEMLIKDNFRINHEEIPRVMEGFNLKTLTEIDLAHLTKSTSSVTAYTGAPLAVSATASCVVHDLTISCEEDISIKCGVLKNLLIELFQSMKISQVTSHMQKVKEILETGKSMLKDGELTQVAKDLLDLFKTLSVNSAYQEHLSEIQTSIDLFKFCAEIQQESFNLFNLTKISEVAIEAAKTYISANEFAELQYHNSACGAYYEEQKSKHIALKIISPPFMLVAGIFTMLLNFDGEGGEVQSETAGLLKSWYYKVYGKLSKPKAINKEKFAKVAKEISSTEEAVHKIKHSEPVQDNELISLLSDFHESNEKPLEGEVLVTEPNSF